MEDRFLLTQLLAIFPGGGAAADALLQEFGSLPRVLGASKERLCQTQAVPPAIAHVIKAAHATMVHCARSRVLGKPIFNKHSDLVAYLRLDSGGAITERVRVLFLDPHNRLIADEILFQGSITHVEFHPREIGRRALEFGASGVAVVHNHPSGDPTPSRQDKFMTYELSVVCANLRVRLYDHFIVTTTGYISFAESKFMEMEGRFQPLSG